MKKIRIKPTTADVSVRPVIRYFKDEIQKMVEYYFAQGKEAHEIAEEIGILDAKEMSRRYDQVLRQYVAATDQLSLETAKIEILRILKRSLNRRDRISAEIDRKEQRIRSGTDEEFPNKELANLREEDKFIYKIMGDLDKTVRPRGKDMSDKAISEVKKANNVETTRAHFTEILVDFEEGKEDNPLTDEIEDALRASMEEEEW